MSTGMKHLQMTWRDDDKEAPKPPPRRKRPTAAFDLWLERGLHQLYDDVAKQPIPEDILKLIEDDKLK
jgi:hypothetical protein